MKPWLELLKLRITVASTVTTFVGYVMARGQFDLPLVPVLAGIMLQACGAAALNQVQDAHRRRQHAAHRRAAHPLGPGFARGAALVYALVLLAGGIGPAVDRVGHGRAGWAWPRPWSTTASTRP